MCSTRSSQAWLSEDEKNAKESTFYLYSASFEDDAGTVHVGTVAQFTYIMGRPLLSRTTAFLPDITPAYSIGERYLFLTDRHVLKEFSRTYSLEGAHRKDWELEVTQVLAPAHLDPLKKPTKIKVGLLQDGILLEEELVSNCFKK